MRWELASSVGRAAAVHVELLPKQWGRPPERPHGFDFRCQPPAEGVASPAMDADRPAVVPPEDAVPPDVVLQSFMDERTGPGAVADWLRALATRARAALGRLRRSS